MKLFYQLSFGILSLAATFIILSFQERNADNRDDQSIQDFTANYEAAYNESNSEKLATFWVPNAIYTNLSTHEILQGKDEIINSFKEQIEDSTGSKLKITIDSIKRDSSNSVIIKGNTVTTFPNEPEEKTVFLAELVRDDNSWKLQRVVEVEDQPVLSHYEELKDLSWLIGKWNSQNDYVDLSLNTEWGENKNFLIQNFTLQILEKKNQEGKQWIGWDPERKKIRSWMIDSDGVFGEGVWNKQGDDWYVGMSYTLPDGRKASATQIYKKMDDNSFTFTSKDRDVDGKILPDIKAITIKKIQ